MVGVAAPDEVEACLDGSGQEFPRGQAMSPVQLQQDSLVTTASCHALEVVPVEHDAVRARVGRGMRPDVDVRIRQHVEYGGHVAFRFRKPMERAQDDVAVRQHVVAYVEIAIGVQHLGLAALENDQVREVSSGSRNLIDEAPEVVRQLAPNVLGEGDQLQPVMPRRLAALANRAPPVGEGGVDVPVSAQQAGPVQQPSTAGALLELGHDISSRRASSSEPGALVAMRPFV